MTLQHRLLKETLSYFYFILKGLLLNFKMFKLDQTLHPHEKWPSSLSTNREVTFVIMRRLCSRQEIRTHQNSQFMELYRKCCAHKFFPDERGRNSAHKLASVEHWTKDYVLPNSALVCFSPKSIKWCREIECRMLVSLLLCLLWASNLGLQIWNKLILSDVEIFVSLLTRLCKWENACILTIKSHDKLPC